MDTFNIYRIDVNGLASSLHSTIKAKDIDRAADKFVAKTSGCTLSAAPEFAHYDPVEDHSTIVELEDDDEYVYVVTDREYSHAQLRDFV